MNKPTSFRLTPEAQLNLEESAKAFGLSQNQAINIILTEPHFENGKEITHTDAITELLFRHFARIIKNKKE